MPYYLIICVVFSFNSDFRNFIHEQQEANEISVIQKFKIIIFSMIVRFRFVLYFPCSIVLLPNSFFEDKKMDLIDFAQIN